MLIYKIFRDAEWAALVRDGETLGAPIDLQDGFIHFSTAAQARETAAKHFSGVSNLRLAAIDTAPIKPELRWEPSRGGQLFPHLYRALRHDEVSWCIDLPLGPQGHVFPDTIE